MHTHICIHIYACVCVYIHVHLYMQRNESRTNLVKFAEDAIEIYKGYDVMCCSVFKFVAVYCSVLQGNVVCCRRMR